MPDANQSPGAFPPGTLSPGTLASLPVLQALETAAGMLAEKVSGLRASLARQETRMAALERQLAETEARLLLEMMHSEGLAAQATELAAAGAEAANVPTGEHYADGTPKTRLTAVYEAAFDAKGHELGVERPESFRAG